VSDLLSSAERWQMVKAQIRRLCDRLFDYWSSHVDEA